MKNESEFKRATHDYHPITETSGTLSVFEKFAEDHIETVENDIKEYADKEIVRLFIHFNDWKHAELLLKYFSTVKEVFLESLDKADIDWEIINQFSDLEILRMSKPKKVGLDFSRLTHLKKIKCYWSNSFAESIADAKNLEILFLDTYTVEDFSALTPLTGLKCLEFYQSRKLQSLHHVNDLPLLEFLTIESCNKLSSLDGLRGNTSLISFVICSKTLTDVSAVNDTNISELTIGSKTTVDTLSYLANNTKIKRLRFACKIADGDLSFLFEMPNLQYVYFRDRRNLSHKYQEVADHLEAKGFNQEALEDEEYSFSVCR